MRVFLLAFLLCAAPASAQWQVVILPFENRTGEPQQEWVSRGISESVVVASYQVPQIHLTDETVLGDTWELALGNAALMERKNIHLLIRGWYQTHDGMLEVHGEIVESQRGNLRKSVDTVLRDAHLQPAVSDIVFALVEDTRIPLEPVQKAAIEKPITADFSAYRTTLNAIRAFRQATQQSPPDARVLARAEAGFKDALQADAHNAHAAYYLARVYELRENTAEAEANYRRALTIDFEHVMARYGLAKLMIKQGRSSEALSELEQALRQSPLNPDIQAAIASLFFSQYEQTFESLTAPLEEMINAAPTDPVGYYELGNAYDELSRDAEAATYFEKAIARDSTFADAHFKLGLIHHRNGDHERAVHHLGRAAEYGTRFSRVYFHLGDILYLLERYDEAEAQFSRAIETEPNYLIPRYHLGMSQLAQGHLAAGSATLLKYADLTVDDARPHIELGKIYQQQGDTTRAIAAFQKALEIGIAETDAHYYLAYIYAGQNRKSDAVKHLKTVLRLHPDHPDADAIQRDLRAWSPSEK
jgi:tetratricopeptide (TPR) repeat protein/TolB-like protein